MTRSSIILLSSRSETPVGTLEKGGSASPILEKREIGGKWSDGGLEVRFTVFTNTSSSLSHPIYTHPLTLSWVNSVSPARF